jgi:hypothetical protein
MKERPISVTIIGWLFIVTGSLGLVYHATEFNRQRMFQDDVLWVSAVRMLAIVGGGFLLCGRNWARTLVVGWLAYHTLLSVYHSVPELLVHAALLAVVTWVLLRADASAYLRPKSTS